MIGQRRLHGFLRLNGGTRQGPDGQIGPMPGLFQGNHRGRRENGSMRLPYQPKVDTGPRGGGGQRTAAAESTADATDRRHLREASLTHLTRATTEARTRRIRVWISGHVESTWRCIQTPQGCHHPPRPQEGRRSSLGDTTSSFQDTPQQGPTWPTK